MAGQYNSYDLDRLSAGEWWEAIKNKKDEEDVPDPIEPHPFPDAVKEMDSLLRKYWCYEAEGWSYSQEKAHDEFVRISNTGNVIEFAAYWARFAERAKEQAEAYENLSSTLRSPARTVELGRTGRCYKAVLANLHIVKRYMAAYFSRTLNVKYSLAVLAVEGIKARFDSEGNPNNPFETIQTLLKPDLTLLTNLNKGLQLSLMSMAFGFATDTKIGTDPWVSFTAAINAREVPRYVLLNQEVKEVEVSKKREMNPWLILVIMALALYGLYYYNKNS